MRKFQDLTPGTVVELTDKMKKLYKDGGFNTETMVILEKDDTESKLCYKTKELEGSPYRLHLHHIERVVDSSEILVDGVEALIEMRDGKFVVDEKNEFAFKLKDNVLFYFFKNEARWLEDVDGINEFLGNKYRILSELPEWVQERTNPFKVGDIVFETCPIEVIEILCPMTFKARLTGGDILAKRLSSQYRLATEGEQARYWMVRAKYLEREWDCEINM